MSLPETITDPLLPLVIAAIIFNDFAYSRPSSKLSVCAIALISSSLAKRISTFSVINSLKESLCLSTQKRSDKVNAIF